MRCSAQHLRSARGGQKKYAVCGPHRQRTLCHGEVSLTLQTIRYQRNRVAQIHALQAHFPRSVAIPLGSIALFQNLRSTRVEASNAQSRSRLVQQEAQPSACTEMRTASNAQSRSHLVQLHSSNASARCRSSFKCSVAIPFGSTLSISHSLRIPPRMLSASRCLLQIVYLLPPKRETPWRAFSSSVFLARGFA